MARAKRSGVPKRLRFDVLKRDAFTCQYCGAKAPDAVLHVDHVHPAAEGGDSDILNLVTSCASCNLGKGPRPLSDSSALAVKHAQLAELQERREQLDMMIAWQKDVADLDGVAADGLAELWASLVRNSELTEHGVKQMRDLVVKYSFGEVADAMRVAVGQYVEKKGPQHALDKIQGICKNRRIEAKHPWMREANHATNIMLKKFDWLRRWRVLADASEAINAGVCADIVLECARSAASPREWENGLRGEIRMAQMPGGGA